MNKTVAHTLFTDFDINLFKAGKHFNLYEKFGAHPIKVNGEEGVYFAVWAPSANKISVIGDFNYWQDQEAQLNVRWDSSGIWEGFIPGAKVGDKYKYKIWSNIDGQILEKADPFAFSCEHPPNTASVIYDLDTVKWSDEKWMSYRGDKNALDKPFAVYEMHLGSWMVNVQKDKPLSYKELAKTLVAYLKKMNYTHVEFMPIMEYPYDPSWGYQLIGYFAPTSRFGSPADFSHLVNELHKNDIGVILDWVPSHFPEDTHGLGNFDGSKLYEHPDKRRGYHPDWKSLIFNYGRNEVKSFLISNALFWIEQYHADALRVDAVSSMLYLDYSREYGEWEPNVYGGNENLEAIDFIKTLNEEIKKRHTDVLTIAEESTAYPGVSRPISEGGLGFDMKWMMGWMHDTLKYFAEDPINRKYHHNEITFSLNYAFTENFMLSISHDEVVYGKKSVFDKMPGSYEDKLANLRLLYGYMYTHPGTKLTFMGSEIGQQEEWNFQSSLNWHLLKESPNKKFQAFFKELNALYQNRPALYEKAFSPEGFEWVSMDDHENSVLAYLRKGHDRKNDLLVVCNFTPITRENYKLGLPTNSSMKQIFNSDFKKYGGQGISNKKVVLPVKEEAHGFKQSIRITLPPLSMIAFEKL